MLIGKITDNEIVYEDSENLQLLVVDDVKYFFHHGDGKLTIEFTGIDTGTMEYCVYDVDLIADEIIGSKEFVDVKLESGKKFVSNIGDTIAVPDIQLTVVDDLGKPVANVAEDGTESHAHEYTQTIYPSTTCATLGYTLHLCTCGDKWMDTFTESLPHTWGEGDICDACGAPRSDPTGAHGAGHFEMRPDDPNYFYQPCEYTSTVVAPTCTEEGFTRHRCTICCCLECGFRPESMIYDSFTNPTGHTFGEWTRTKEPSADASGEETRYCACGEEERRTIYAVTVNSGTANKATAITGETVNITANTAPSGQVFDKWTTTSPDVTFASVNATSTTFTMPANAVTVTATYKTTGGGTEQPQKGIFGTNPKWYGAWWHYLLFFFCFGFIWMWF